MTLDEYALRFRPTELEQLHGHGAQTMIEAAIDRIAHQSGVVLKS